MQRKEYLYSDLLGKGGVRRVCFPRMISRGTAVNRAVRERPGLSCAGLVNPLLLALLQMQLHQQIINEQYSFKIEAIELFKVFHVNCMNILNIPFSSNFVSDKP